MAMKSLSCQLMLMALMIVYIEIGARVNVPILPIYQINGHQYTESCRRWSYSGPNCDSNMKSETETYATHLIFMQLPGISWNDQKLKAFFKKMNCIIH